MADARIKAILDTSIYIPFINGGVVHPILEIDIGKPVIYLSAVVIAELYAGAFDNQSIKLLDKLYKAFYDTQRIVPHQQTIGKLRARLLLNSEENTVLRTYFYQGYRMMSLLPFLQNRSERLL